MTEPVRVTSGACPFCLGIGGGEMRLDKKQRPYFVCVTCGTRAFIHTEIAYRTFKWILSSGISYAREAARSASLEPVGAGVEGT